MSNKVNISEKPSIELIEMLNRIKARHSKRDKVVHFIQKLGNVVICYACLICINFLCSHQELKFGSYDWFYWGGIFTSGAVLIHNLLQFLNWGSKK